MYRSRSVVQRQIRNLTQERKTNDAHHVFNDIIYDSSNNNFVQPINLMDQGTRTNQRIGNKIQLDTLHINGFIQATWPQGISENSDTFAVMGRILIIRDKSPTGTTVPIKSEILAHLDGPSVLSNWYDKLNPFKTKRFITIWDQMYTFNPSQGRLQFIGTDPPGATISATEINRNVDHHFKGKKIKFTQQYDDTEGDYASVSTNCLYLIVTTNLSSTMNPHAIGTLDIDVVTKIRYFDA